jgi:thiol:disulfide interchange protein/DsbC/DsbD-like thiol-disulfide interchange protein
MKTFFDSLGRSLSTFMLSFVLASPAMAQPVDGGRATVELIADHRTVAPGQTITAALKLTMDPGWHVYWRNAGDAGLPPELIVREGSALAQDAIGDFIWPIPHLLPVVEGEIMDYGYDDEVVLAFPLKIPASASGEMTLAATADYLICEEICIPETADVNLTLGVGTPLVNAVAGEQIGTWIAKAPIDFPGEARLVRAGDQVSLSLKGPVSDVASLRFFPFGHGIIHSAPQPFETGKDGATLTLTPSDDLAAPLEGIIISEDNKGARQGYTIRAQEGEEFAGTAGTAASAQSSAGGSSAGLGAPLMALIGFAFLGGLILNLMPCVLPVLSMKAIGMVQAAASGHRGELRAHGLWYTAGVLISFGALAAIIIGVRAATSESLTLGFQLQNGPTVALLALLMFAVGLWLLGTFELGTSIQNTGNTLAMQGGSAGAFFTGVLAAVVGAPCVGPFLSAALGAVMTRPPIDIAIVFLAMGFGMALPFLILSFVPGLQRLLPKPGRWMDTLKQVFAFPMFLTAAWLLSVLGALSGPSAVAWTLAGATALGFAVWLARRGGVARGLALIALIGAGALAAFNATAPAEASATTAYAAKFETESWSPARVDALIAEGRPVFVDFTAAWCATCQVNKSTTLKSKPVQEAFEKANVAFLVADFTRKDKIIADELKARGRAGVPMYLWYAPGKAEPEILPEILSPDLITALVARDAQTN